MKPLKTKMKVINEENVSCFVDSYISTDPDSFWTYVFKEDKDTCSVKIRSAEIVHIDMSMNDFIDFSRNIKLF